VVCARLTLLMFPTFYNVLHQDVNNTEYESEFNESITLTCEHHARLSVTLYQRLNFCQNCIQFRIGVLYTSCGASRGSVAGILHKQHKFFYPYFYTVWEIWTKYGVEKGTRYRSWLRHSATSRKVAGSIPDGVIGIFH